MTYKVIEGFYDLQDPEGKSFHFYDKGDTYPREGFETSEERIAELLGNGNKLQRPLIEAVPEETPAEVPEEVPAVRKTRKK